jgi:NitT/TauT family transport system permease protein
VSDRTREMSAPDPAIRVIGPSQLSWSSLVLPAVAVGLAILSWWAIVAVFAIPEYILPSPGSVFASMAENQDELLANAWATGRVAALGLLLSVLCGVPVGLVVARYKLARRVLMPPIVAIQSLPKVALAPLFVAWLGFGAAPKLIITVLVTFFPLTLATIVGVESIRRSTTYLAQSMGCRSFAFLRYIQLPSAAPFIGAAFRTSATLAVVGALVAEFVGSIDGLGNLLLIASGNRDTSLAFAAIVSVGLLGVLFYVGAAALVRAATARLGPRYMGSVTT